MEQRYDVLFHQHPLPMFELDRRGRLVACNHALSELTGYSQAQLHEMEHTPFVHPDDAPVIADNLRRALEGERRTYDVRGTTRDDDAFVVTVTNVPIAVDGEVVGVYGIAQDVTQRVTAQGALEVSERRFRGLFEGAGVGIAITTLEGRFEDANPPFLRMLGYTLDQLRKRDLESITHPDDRQDIDRRLRALLDGRVSAFLAETRYLDAVGDPRWVRASMSVIRDGDGRPLHLAATTQDITAAKLADADLRWSENLRRLAGQLASVGGWSVEGDTGQVRWSEEVFRILDADDAKEPSLDDAMSMYPPGDRERLAAALEACKTEGTPFDLKLQIDTFTGRRIPVRSIGEPDRDASGRIRRVIGAFQDTSELEAADARNADLAQRLSAIFESVTDGVVLLDHDWVMTYVNGRGEQILQRSRSALLGRNVWEVFPEAVGTEVDAVYRRAVEERTAQRIDEYEFPPLDAWLEIHVYPNDEGLALYFRDITQQRQAREALQQRETMLRRQAELLDEAQDAIIVRDLAHHITYWNRSAERVYGWAPDEALHRDARSLLHHEPRAFDAAMAAVLEDGSWVGEFEHLDRSGRPLTVDARWTLVRDDHGQPDGVLAINTEVTERKRLEQQLLRAQRMDSLGTLAGGVAHDLNNVLSPILLAAELLEAPLSAAESEELVRTIASSARRGADLVSQVLSFARGLEGQRAPVDIARLLDDVRSIVRDTFPKDVALRIDAPGDLGRIMADRTQLQQVLLNLAVNARDAMPDGGQLTMTASSVTLDPRYAASIPDASSGDHVLIEVEDDGEGMSSEVIDRIFEPFFTTKPQGAGTGLGLSTATAIVRSHGGFLQVYSEVGRGSRFLIYLPRASGSDALPPDAAEEDGPLPRGRGETVLVVDDEPAVRGMTRQTLEAFEYQVLEASDGAEAVAVFAQHRERIDVVLTDMMMPVMDGPATIRALQRLEPHVRIIGASGLHANGKVAQATAAGVRHFLPKPFSTRSLLEAIDQVIGRAEAPEAT